MSTYTDDDGRTVRRANEQWRTDPARLAAAQEQREAEIEAMRSAIECTRQALQAFEMLGRSEDSAVHAFENDLRIALLRAEDSVRLRAGQTYYGNAAAFGEGAWRLNS